MSASSSTCVIYTHSRDNSPVHTPVRRRKAAFGSPVPPPLRRRLNFADDEERALGAEEAECRRLMAANVLDDHTITSSVFTLQGALAHFITNFPSNVEPGMYYNQNYMIEHPQLHMHGFIELLSVDKKEVGIDLVGLLPLNRHNLEFFLESIVTIFTDERPSFRIVQRVVIATSYNAHMGLLPSKKSSPATKTKAYNLLKKYGIEGILADDVVVPLDADQADTYLHYVLTRALALRNEKDDEQ